MGGSQPRVRSCRAGLDRPDRRWVAAVAPATRGSNRCLNSPLAGSTVRTPAPRPGGSQPWPRKTVTELPDGPPDATGLTPRQQRVLAHDQGRDREARLPAQHARDRRGRRADQLLQRRPPAQGARGEGLPQARPQPAAGARGVPARGDGGPALARLGRGVQRSTRPASATRCRRRRTSRCSAGSPPVARSWPRRTSRRSSRCPRAWSARASCSCSRSRGDSMVDAAICDGDYVVIRQAADRRERRHRRGAARRRGDGQDLPAQGRQGLAAPPQRGLRADRRHRRHHPRQGDGGPAPGLRRQSNRKPAPPFIPSEM